MVAAANRSRQKWALPELAFEALEPHVMKGMDHLYRYCFPELWQGAGERVSPEDMARVYADEYGSHIADETVAYDGIPEALRELAGMARLIVYTNKPEALSRQLLAALRLDSYVSQVIGCDTYPQTKPAQEPMQAAAKNEGFTPGNNAALFLGDSQADMLAAREFGAHAIWCGWGYYAVAPTNPPPDSTVRTPEEVVAIAQRVLFV